MWVSIDGGILKLHQESTCTRVGKRGSLLLEQVTALSTPKVVISFSYKL
jgi:hypothetical protein